MVMQFQRDRYVIRFNQKLKKFYKSIKPIAIGFEISDYFVAICKLWW